MGHVTRRHVIFSTAAIELLWGGPAIQYLKSGAGAANGIEVLAPGWWRWIYRTSPRPNPAVRVSVENGPVIWRWPAPLDFCMSFALHSSTSRALHPKEESDEPECRRG